MHHVEDALPARKAGQPGREFPVVSESIIRGLRRGCASVVEGRREREVNDQRPGHDCLARNKPQKRESSL